MDYACHRRHPDRWCDRNGSGGFMGHTCQRQNKRSGWFNWFRLRCWLKSCPCKTTHADEAGGWFCVDCGEVRGQFDR